MSLPHSLFLVIFGASGDLTRRKLMPALIKIHNGKRFPSILPLSAVPVLHIRTKPIVLI